MTLVKGSFKQQVVKQTIIIMTVVTFISPHPSVPLATGSFSCRISGLVVGVRLQRHLQTVDIQHPVKLLLVAAILI